MTCDDVRPLLLAYARGTLTDRAAVAAHLEGCAACARLVVAEGALDDALGRLPQAAASLALKRRLRGQAPPAPAALPRRRLALVGAGVAALAAAVALWLVLRAPGTRPVEDEALADHLRVVASAHPLDVESGGVHQVKPWFSGRLDFAPRVGDSGDDFPLAGGALAIFEGRKAATFVYKRRLHTISLFVVPAGGLDWPSGPRRVAGFNQRYWRDGELGYVLVSDVDGGELDELARRLRAP
jgi:anti-sigma factor RsiW